MASGLGSSCAFEVNGTCYTAPFTPTPLTSAECNELKDKLGIQYCGTDHDDYWGGAVKQCGGVSKMPTMTQLAELASQLYVGNPSIGGKENKSGIQMDSNSLIVKSLGLTPSFYLWSNEESNSAQAYFRSFDDTTSYFSNAYRSYNGFQAVCFGD